MLKTLHYLAFVLILILGLGLASLPQSERVSQPGLQPKVDSIIRPIMQEFNVPGLSVAITVGGKHYFYNYGLASKDSRKPVDSQTLFEIGSISKTFTATLASFAQVNGSLSFSNSVSTYLPDLRGSHFDNITVLNLATHTTGGLPLQVPDEVSNAEQLTDYLKRWKPSQPAGTHRSYSNPGTGLLGMVAAKSLGLPFEEAVRKNVLNGLNLRHTYFQVPENEMPLYAQGYDKNDKPVRVNPGVLATEAYGLKSSSEDMIRFLDANMQLIKVQDKLQRALLKTQTGYFQISEMTQDLMWEQYPYPTALKALLAGNSARIIFEHNPATPLNPPATERERVFINKTGSTNGFGGYVAFIPAKKIGIVILANKNYPIPSRVTAGHALLALVDR